MERYVKEMHKPVVYHFPTRRILTTGLDEYWTSDVLDLAKYASENKNYKYILVVQDMFSRFLWLKPLKNKTTKTVKSAFEEIFKIAQPKKGMLTDMGKEYTGHLLKTYLKEHGITLYHIYGSHKAAMSERSVKTVKNLLYRGFTRNSNNEWISHLDELTTRYNNRRHRTLKISPYNARKPEYNYIVMKQNLKRRKFKASKVKYRVNDLVRISKSRKIFAKSYKPTFSQEQFRIRRVIKSRPVTYLLVDLFGVNIEGCFYSQELQKSQEVDTTGGRSKTIKDNE